MSGPEADRQAWDCLEITGARWGLDTAQAILTLRAIKATGDLDNYWPYHRLQEHRRTYPASLPPTTLTLAA